MKYTLFTTYYLAEDTIRNEENAICLKNNISNEQIDKIYLVLQNQEKPQIDNTEKVEFVFLGRRPMFSDFFSLITEYKKTSDNRCIIANSDIYFTDSLSLLDNINLKNKVVTLTRWDLQNDDSIVFYNKYLSQDVWIVDDNIPTSIGQYYIGQHGCDNRLLKELADNGFKIINPSLNVKTIHVHMSALRPYFNDTNYKYVEGPYRYSLPSGILNPFRLFWLKFINPKRYNLYRVNLKDYYYIRFEYFYKSFKNELQKFDLNFFIRLTSLFPSIYYYSLFKISK